LGYYTIVQSTLRKHLLWHGLCYPHQMMDMGMCESVVVQSQWTKQIRFAIGKNGGWCMGVATMDKWDKKCGRGG
jgi:hypothetical protein